MKSFWAGKNVLLTGGAGFLGKFVTKELLSKGVKPKNLEIPRSSKTDLKIWSNCLKVTKNKDIVIHLAGNVGGIGKNRQMPATLFYDNAVMSIQLMEAARINKVKKFVAVGTVCAYPKFTKTPFKESDFWLGYPEETNAPYGLAKKMLLVQAQAYRKQYGFNAIYLIPVNLYGPGDNFDLKTSHVIPALIKKVIDAREKNRKFIEVWGDGSPTREFLYVGDAARAIVLASEKYDKPDPVNLGSGKEISIKNLVKLVSKLIDFKGEIRFDKSKPNGQPRRLLDISRAKEEFGFKAEVDFEEGLKKIINWYISEYSEKLS